MPAGGLPRAWPARCNPEARPGRYALQYTTLAHTMSRISSSPSIRFCSRYLRAWYHCCNPCTRDAGYKTGIMEQLETGAEAKKRDPKGIIQRRITSIETPSTQLEPSRDDSIHLLTCHIVAAPGTASTGWQTGSAGNIAMYPWLSRHCSCRYPHVACAVHLVAALPELV